MPLDIRRARQDDLTSWFECVTTAFLDRPDAALMATQVQPLWDFERVWAAVDGPVVGTLRTWATELTVPGGAHLPASGVSAVSVRSTHRRRGLLRSMIAAEHAATRERGEPISMLYTAETGIYGRFGYGPAVRKCTWTLDVLRTKFLTPAATGMDLLPVNEQTRDLIQLLHERYRRAQVGELRRRDDHFGRALGLIEFAWNPPWKGWVAIHRDDNGEPDGYVRYSADSKWDHGQPQAVINVDDLVALSDAAHDAIWRFLADTDLVTKVVDGSGSPDDRLPWLLTNSRAAEMSGVGDGLWVNLLDVPRALGARTTSEAAISCSRWSIRSSQTSRGASIWMRAQRGRPAPRRPASRI